MQRLRHYSGFGGVISGLTSKETGSKTTKYMGLSCAFGYKKQVVFGVTDSKVPVKTKLSFLQRYINRVLRQTVRGKNFNWEMCAVYKVGTAII